MKIPSEARDFPRKIFSRFLKILYAIWALCCFEILDLENLKKLTWKFSKCWSNSIHIISWKIFGQFYKFWYFGIDSRSSLGFGRVILPFHIDSLRFPRFDPSILTLVQVTLSFPRFGQSILTFPQHSLSFTGFGQSILTFPQLTLSFTRFGPSILTLP